MSLSKDNFKQDMSKFRLDLDKFKQNFNNVYYKKMNTTIATTTIGPSTVNINIAFEVVKPSITILT